MKRRPLTNLVGPALVIAGLVAACANAYVIGMTYGRPAPSLPSDVMRLRSVRLTSISGVAGGTVLVVVGLAIQTRRDKRPPEA